MPDILGGEETAAPAENTEVSKEQKEIDELKSALAELVGEDKKFKSTEDLAKGKKESDAFIEHLTAEQKELRAELARTQEALRASQTKAELEEMRSELSQKTPDKPVAPPAEEKRTDPAELQELIDRRLEERETLSRAQANINSVNEELAKAFGGDSDKAKEAVTARVAELGLTPEHVKNLAATSPNAALKLLVPERKQVESPVGQTKSNVNTAAMGMTGGNDSKEYFDNLRKTNSRMFFSPEVQNRIFELKKQGKL